MDLPALNPFVGRSAELAELDAALDAVLGRTGRLVLVSGEPGIGKTTLCAEFTVAARSRHVPVYWGRCWEAGGAPAYWPWVEVIRQLLTSADASGALSLGRAGDYLAQLVPELADRLGVPLGAVPSLADPESARFFLFDAVATLMKSAAARQPIVVIVDDCQAADRASLLLLAFLARALAENGVLLIATYRELEVSARPDLVEPLAELGRQGRRLSLHGLTAADVAQLLEGAAGLQPSAALTERIHGVTDGNPFFVGEVVRLLVATEPFDDRGEPTAALGIPDGVREAVRRRCEPLSADSARVLEIAAVIGREFEAAVVSIAADEDLLCVLEALADPLQRGLVVEVEASSGRFRFRHALIREVLYESLPPARRLRLHRRIGQALATLSTAAPDRYVAELAHHFLLAAPCGGDEYVEHGVRAARRALAQMAFEEAAQLFERVIAALTYSAPDERRRCELLLELGEAREWANDAAAARTAFEHAASIARRLGAADLLVKAALGVGAVPARKAATSRCDAAPELLREALAVISPDDVVARARILSRLALHGLSTGVDNEAMELSAAAVAMARLAGDREALDQALTARHAVLFGPDHVPERRAIAEELLEIAAALGSRQLAMRGHALRATISLEVGDLVATAAALDTHARLAEEAADPFERWVNLVWRSARAQLTGKFDLAEDYSRQAMDLVENIPGPHTAELYGPVTFAGQKILIDEARDTTIPDVALALHYGTKFPEASTWRVANLAVLMKLGRSDEVRREIEVLCSGNFLDFERNGTWLATMTFLSEAIEFLGDRERAATLYPLLLPFADRNATVSVIACRGSVSRPLGLLAATLGRWPDAARHLQAAIAMNERMGAAPHVAIASYDYARLLARHGDLAERAPAIELARRALGLARDLEMLGLVGRCEALVTTLSDHANESVPQAPGHDAIRLQKNGQFWILSRAGETVHLKDAKGLTYIAELLRHPDREIHVQHLLALFADSCAARTTGTSSETSAPRGPGFADELIDVKARREYQRRLDTLSAELERSEVFGDPERTVSLRQEVGALRRELARATALGGRRRRSSDTERARINVTRTIRLALTRIVEASPALGGELARSIHTGAFCSYAPAASSGQH